MSNILINKDLKIDCSSIDNNSEFVINKDEEHFLLLNKLATNFEYRLLVEDGAVLHLSILADSRIENLKLTANLGLNAKIIVYFADFSYEINKSEVIINLNKPGAEAIWKLASLSSKKDNKNINVSVYHNAPQTTAKVDNYGVAKDNSKLLFSGDSYIYNGMVKSKTQQNAKIMVFDNDCIAKVKPMLRIDENDIEAGHAAAVGKISDEHIFYLTSRGLTLEESKMLITLGYLKPIFKGFNEEDVAYMNEIMEGRL